MLYAIIYDAKENHMQIINGKVVVDASYQSFMKYCKHLTNESAVRLINGTRGGYLEKISNSKKRKKTNKLRKKCLQKLEASTSVC